MKNKMADVRDHLVSMLEQLGDPEVKGEVVERAKATALVAGQYISAVRTEIDALRLAEDIGQLPAAVAPRVELQRINGTVTAIEGRNRRA